MDSSTTLNDADGRDFLLSQIARIKTGIEHKEQAIKEDRRKLKNLTKAAKDLGAELPGDSSFDDEQVQALLVKALTLKSPQTSSALKASVKAAVKTDGGSASGLPLSVARVLKRDLFVESSGAFSLKRADAPSSAT